MKGLKEAIPNVDERREWIIREMIWSFCPTYATHMICRRNYLGKASGNKNYQGVLAHVYQQDFLALDVKNGEVTMATGEKVKFDVIVGNPPYHQKDGGHGASAKALYTEFVMKAIEANPKYLSMVIPARWMLGGGRSTKSFLEKMIRCGKISDIEKVDDASEWFPDVEIKGGAMYFLYDASKTNAVANVNGFAQDLTGAEFIVTDTVALSIKDKVFAKTEKFFDTVVSSQKPYALRKNHSVWQDGPEGAYVCHCNGGEGKGENVRFVSKSLVTNGQDTIDKWKVCVPVGNGSGRDGISYALIVPPNEIVTETYILFGTYDSEKEAKSAHAYLHTRFAQFMCSVLKVTQDISKRVFKWLPYLDFTRSYTDSDLYAMFDLSVDEIAYIEEFTKDFPIYGAKKRGKR
jgi:site-specific DNA-methyltransferase (adenine-specific)